ncbi:cell division protein FtsX [Clostridia bacterium]|nr:cell division protein FtsX [Clostridia bacterium]
MRKYQVGYFFREGVRGIFLHGFMSFAAVGVIAACLLITGSVSLLALNVDRMIKDIQSQNEILVIIDEKLSEAEAKSVGTKIAQMSNVADRVFISKEKALEEYAEQMGENSYVLAGFEDKNPLRHRFVVKLFDVSLMTETTEQLREIAGVAEIKAQPEITAFIMGLRGVVNAVSVSLILMLLFVSIFIISNTVKLATFDRREEIGIMRVVGATNGFIRWPFIVEGFLLGIMGGVLAFIVQWALYNYVAIRVTEEFRVVQVMPFGDILALVAGAFVLFGFVVGVLGSVVTIRKFLKV